MGRRKAHPASSRQCKATREPPRLEIALAPNTRSATRYLYLDRQLEWEKAKRRQACTLFGRLCAGAMPKLSRCRLLSEAPQ